MTRWNCGIRDCDAVFDDVEAVIVHQTTEHERHTCKVCDAVVPEGYFAIRHALDEHTRAEYVRSYEADATAIREREEIKAQVERAIDIEDVIERLADSGLV